MALDPVTALRYVEPPGQTFAQKRDRLNKHQTNSPYDRDTREDLTSYAFNVEDIDNT